MSTKWWPFLVFLERNAVQHFRGHSTIFLLNFCLQLGSCVDRVLYARKRPSSDIHKSLMKRGSTMNFRKFQTSFAELLSCELVRWYQLMHSLDLYGWNPSWAIRMVDRLKSNAAECLLAKRYVLVVNEDRTAYQKRRPKWTTCPWSDDISWPSRLVGMPCKISAFDFRGAYVWTVTVFAEHCFQILMFFSFWPSM